jgi:putative flippase GtrA
MTSRPYFKYLVVGGIVGLLAIAAREILAYMLPGDSPGYYLLSVIIIYAGGIIASFYGHFHVSFSHVKDKSATLVSMFKFTLVALAGMGATATLSYQIRYNLGLETVFGPLLPSFAFGMAALTASLLTYSLNARYIFVEHATTLTAKTRLTRGDF